MRSTPIFKILSLAVLVAVVTLLGIEGYRYFHRSVSVSVAYTGQVTDSLSVTGWVVRQETPLPDTSGTLLRQVQEGEKVHAGQTVAMAYASKSALEVVSQLEDTELKLQQLQFARSSFLDSDAALKVDSDISDSILRLHIATADGDYATATQEMSAMKTAVLKRSYSYESLEQINFLCFIGSAGCTSPATGPAVIPTLVPLKCLSGLRLSNPAHILCRNLLQES